MTWRGSKNRTVTLKLGHAVEAQRIRFILLSVGTIERSIKDVVGTDVNKPSATLCAKMCDPPGTLGIDASSLIMVALTTIDIGGGSAIHHHITGTESESSKSRFSLFRI
jgi:hypothetical protein